MAVDRLAVKCGGVALCVVVDNKGMAYGDARIGNEVGSKAYAQLFRDICAATLSTVGAGPEVLGPTVAVDNNSPAAASDAHALDTESPAPVAHVVDGGVSADNLGPSDVALSP